MKRVIAGFLLATMLSAIITMVVFSLDTEPEEPVYTEAVRETVPDTIVINDEKFCKTPMVKDGVNEEYISSPTFGFKPLELPINEEIQKYLYQVCNSYGIDYAFALGTIQHESTFNVNARHVNPNGTTDRGLCQVNSCWVDDCKQLGFIGSAEDLYDPYRCIDCGMWILSSCVDELGNTESAYYAYNTGRYQEGSNKNSRAVWNYKTIFDELLR